MAAMDEREGSRVLRRAFEEAGLRIEEGYRLPEPPVALDGFDPGRRVGYEFITTEAGDRAEFTPEAVTRLEEGMRRGELAVLLVDERDGLEAAELTEVAAAFLARLREEGRL